MTDALFILTAIACFAATAWLVHAFERLRKR